MDGCSVEKYAFDLVSSCVLSILGGKRHFSCQHRTKFMQTWANLICPQAECERLYVDELCLWGQLPFDLPAGVVVMFQRGHRRFPPQRPAVAVLQESVTALIQLHPLSSVCPQAQLAIHTINQSNNSIMNTFCLTIFKCT